MMLLFPGRGQRTEVEERGLEGGREEEEEEEEESSQLREDIMHLQVSNFRERESRREEQGGKAGEGEVNRKRKKKT